MVIAREDANRRGPSSLYFEVHEVGEMKVMERQVVHPKPATVPLDPSAPPSPHDEPMGTPMQWTLTYFIPRGEYVDSYEINFFLLTREQYEKDKDFLRKIVESIRYDRSAQSTPPAPTPAPSTGGDVPPPPLDPRRGLPD